MSEFSRQITLVGVPKASIRLVGQGVVQIQVSDKATDSVDKLSCISDGDDQVCDLWSGHSAHFGGSNIKTVTFAVTPSSVGDVRQLSVEIVGSRDLAAGGHLQAASLRWRTVGGRPWDDVYARFDVQDELGHGSFGTVYNAVDKTTGEIAALKQIQKDYSSREVLESELSILSRLPKHPNICGFLGLYEDATYVWMALQKCGNTSIRAYYNVRKASEDKARYLFRQMVAGVSAMHEAGIYHRDLKSNNMQLTLPQGLVQLIDFGESVLDDTPRQDFFGAEGYSTPEATQGKNYRPSLMDVWVLGVTLYRMRFNVKPFGRGWDIDYSRKVISLNYDFPEPVSAEFEDLIRSMLQYEENRLTLAEVTNHPWLTMH